MPNPIYWPRNELTATKSDAFQQETAEKLARLQRRMTEMQQASTPQPEVPKPQPWSFNRSSLMPWLEGTGDAVHQGVQQAQSTATSLLPSRESLIPWGTPPAAASTTPLSAGSVATAPAAASGVPQAMPSAASAAAPQGGGKADRYSTQIAQVAREEGVPYDVLAGLIDTEQSGEDSVSPAGARGIMQVVPGQGYDHPGENAADPLTSIRQGARAVKDKYNATGSWERAGRAYFGYGVDAGGMTTDRYGQIYDANRARYQGAPTAAAPTAAGSPSPAPAADSSRSAAGASQQMITIRHKGTGAVSRVFASTWNPRDITNYSEFEVVPDQMQKVGDTQIADDTGGLSPGDQKRQKLGLSGPEQMPGTISGPSDNATDPTMPSDYGSSLRTPGPLPIERQPDHVNDVNTEIRDRLNQQMYRQPLQATSGPDSTAGADPSSSYNDPTADGTLSQPLPAQSDSSVMTADASPTVYRQSADGSPTPSLDPSGAQQSAPFTPPSGLQAVYDAGGRFLHWIQGAAQGVAQAAASLDSGGPPVAEGTNLDVPSGHSPDTRGSVMRALETPITPPERPAPLVGPYDLSNTTAFPTQESRNQYTSRQAAADASAVPYQIAEATRSTIMDAARSFADAIRAGQEGRPLAAAGNTLWALIQATPQMAGFSIAQRTIDEMIPEARIAGVGPGAIVGLESLIGDGIKGVNGLKNAPGRLLSPENMARADEAVSGVAGAVRSGVESAGRGIRGALDANAANVAAADARMAEQGSTVARIPAAGGYAGHDTPFVVYDRQGKRVATVTDENYAAQLAREHGGRYEFDQTAPSVAEPIRSTNMSVEEAQQRGYTILGPDGQPADLAALDEEVRRARSPSYDPSLPTPYRESSSPRADQALTSDYGPRIETVSDAQRGAHSIENVQSARGEGAYSNSPVPPNFDQQVLARDDVPRDPRSINLNARPGASASAGLIGDVANSLGSGVAGAGAGAALPAETDEERRRNALIGAGVGMVAGPSIGRVLPHEGGALATFGASPNYRPPTPAQIKAAEVQGARRGEMLNREVKPPGSSVPLGARLSTALTDPLAATRYAENLLTDTAGVPRLPDNSPLRASTLLRENPTGFIKDRIETELVAPVIEAAQKGLQTELPRYVEDTHQRDILDKFYGQAWQGVIDERTQKIADAQARGVAPVVIARMQAKMQADAVQAGETAMRRRQGSNAEHTYEATNARLLEQEQRLTASGTFGDLQSLAQQIWDASQKTLDNSVAAGRVEPQVAADLKAMYPHYVPTVPISKLDPGGRSFGASSGGTTVGASKTNPIHALEDVGSSSERLNPIVAVRNQIVTQERQNHQNQVFQAFAQLMDNAGVPTPGTMGKKPNLWEGERQISGRINGQPETRMVPASVANGIESMTQAGMGPDAAVNVYKKVVGWFAGQLTAARASYIPLNLARDAGDTFFNTMVKNGGPARLPRVMGTWLDEASRAVADVAAAQATPRGIVGAAGGFAYGATQVDDQNAPISTRLLHGVEAAIPGAFLLGANKNVNVSSRAANDFIARGGASGGISSGWRPGQRWYRDVLRDGGAPIRSPQDMALFMRDWAGDVWNLQGLKGANERLDLVGRTTAMRVAEARGAGPTEAMIAGRDSSYDPDKAGTILRAVNGMIPFTNATVQGGAQFARALRDHPGTTLATVAATLAPVMLGVEAWNRSDPQRAQIYDNVPQYLKDSGIVWVPPVEWGQGSDTRGSLPKYLWFPTEITTPFVVGMRGAMQHLDKVVPGLQPSAGRSDVNPDAPEWQKWLGVLNEAVQIFNPTHGDTAAAIASGAVPPVIKQTMELGLNKDLYRGNAIMSDPADERASALSQGISRTSNDLGRTFNSPFLQNVRPSGVEHILRADPAHYDIASGISDQVKPSPYKAAEQGRIANEPFVGGIASRFVRDTGGANLERAVGAANTPDLQAALQDARMRPSEVDVTVPATVGTLPLNRDEQLEAQNRMNEYLPEELAKAQSNPKWSDPTQAQVLLKAAVSRARTRATTEIIRTIPKDEQNDRTRQQTDAKLAVGAR